MFKILVALIKSPKARAIVWLHLTHLSRWTVGECAAVIGPAVLGLFLLLLWPSPAPQPEKPHSAQVIQGTPLFDNTTSPVNTTLLDTNTVSGVGFTTWIGSPTGGEKGAGTINITSAQIPIASSGTSTVIWPAISSSFVISNGIVIRY